MEASVMNNRIVRNIQYVLQNFEPQPRYTLYSTRDKLYVPENKGILNPLNDQ